MTTTGWIANGLCPGCGDGRHLQSLQPTMAGSQRNFQVRTDAI